MMTPPEQLHLATCRGLQTVPRIAPVGPTLTRPELYVIPRLNYPGDKLYGGADSNCDHYVTYAPGGGVRCIRCPGWYCA